MQTTLWTSLQTSPMLIFQTTLLIILQTTLSIILLTTLLINVQTTLQIIPSKLPSAQQVRDLLYSHVSSEEWISPCMVGVWRYVVWRKNRHQPLKISSNHSTLYFILTNGNSFDKYGYYHCPSIKFRACIPLLNRTTVQYDAS